jgi:hypothetical protein
MSEPAGPAGPPIGHLRPVRDEIDTRVRALLHELTGQETISP